MKWTVISWKDYLNKFIEGPITVERSKCCDWSLDKFMQVNFSKLSNSNQIFRNNFVCILYHLCENRAHNVESKIFYLEWTLYNTIYSLIKHCRFIQYAIYTYRTLWIHAKWRLTWVIRGQLNLRNYCNSLAIHPNISLLPCRIIIRQTISFYQRFCSCPKTDI